MELNIQTRTVLGKGVKAIRKQGLIPAEVYGHGAENVHVSVPAKEFRKIFKEAGETTVITLVDERAGKTPVIIANVALDYVKDDILAVDFHRVRLDEKLEAAVPVVFTGSAPAEKKGLILVRVTPEIEIEALPQDIPHRFSIDLSGLAEAGDGIYIKDLKAIPGVKIRTHGDVAIVTVTEPRKEEEEPVAAATAAETPPATEEPK